MSDGIPFLISPNVEAELRLLLSECKEHLFPDLRIWFNAEGELRHIKRA